MNSQLVDVANLVASLATAGALVLAYVTYKGSTNAQVFMEYTRRYGEVMAAFPDELGSRSVFSSPPAPSPALTLAVLRYLNLCSEELYMHRNGMLSARVWRIWEAEIRRKLASPLVTREWSVLRHEFVTFPAFCRFVDDAQGAAAYSSATGAVRSGSE